MNRYKPMLFFWLLMGILSAGASLVCVCLQGLTLDVILLFALSAISMALGSYYNTWYAIEKLKKEVSKQNG